MTDDQPRDDQGRFTSPDPSRLARIARWIFERLPENPAPLSGSDGVGLRAWAGDLSYQEVHAATWGFALMAAAVTTGSDLFAITYIGLLAYAFTGRKARAKSMGVDVPESVWKQTRAEPHYFALGGGLGWLAPTAAAHFGYTVQIPF